MVSRSGTLVLWKIRLALIVSLLTSITIPTSLMVAAPSEQADQVRDLWFDISLGPPLVDWFNDVARPDDIARVERVSQIDLLDEITTGRKLVVFRSIREAEEALPHIAERIDIVGYNLETGHNNPVEELADPVGSVKRMHKLARKYDLLLAFGPDHTLAVSDGSAIAPYVDIFVLQVQRVQTQPDTVFSFVLPLIPRLRQANPDLEISVQVRTEGDVEEIVDLIDDMNHHLDGVSILTSPETVDIAEALVAELQAREDAISGAPTIIAQSAPTPAKEMKPETPLAPAQAEEAGISCPLMVAGAFIAGGVGGGVTAALICARKRAGGAASERS